jgi:hypothetical protein
MMAKCVISHATTVEYVLASLSVVVIVIVFLLHQHHQHHRKGNMNQDTDVWEGKVTPYDGRFVAQSDSLTISGLCIMPAHHLAAYVRANGTKIIGSQLTVAVWWKSNPGAGNRSIESKVKGTFTLYGPLDMASSIVKAVGNEADGGEMRVLREQSVRVSLCDADGNNRVGGEDADLFFLDFFAGPSRQPQVCLAHAFFSVLSNGCPPPGPVGKPEHVQMND